MSGEASSEALRIRYYDWCSAKVAGHFLSLPPEEVWHRATLAREVPAGADAETEVVAGTTFDLLRLLAQQLAAELELPPFEEWVVEYGTDPVRFEQDILSLGMTPAVPELDSNLPSS
jgi:hypothetical protein